jgi:hypothetical protein
MVVKMGRKFSKYSMQYLKENGITPLEDMKKFCIEKQIYDINNFENYCRENRKDWYEFLHKSTRITFVIYSLCKKIKEDKQKKI